MNESFTIGGGNGGVSSDGNGGDEGQRPLSARLKDISLWDFFQKQKDWA